MNQTLWVIKVFGESTDYYVGDDDGGSLSPTHARKFENYGDARAVAVRLHTSGVITRHWEIKTYRIA